MPELPEVEAVRQGLNRLVTGRKIEHIQVLWPRIVDARTPEEVSGFEASLAGSTIQKVSRRGKYLLFYLDDGILVSHLRMEGKFHFFPQVNLADLPAHVHLKCYFSDQSLLVYQDVRKFGRFERLELGQEAEFFAKKKIGPEPTADCFLLPDFMESLAKSQQMIKPALLSQRLVAGLGNIYVDECLYQAGIHPARRAKDLRNNQIIQLHQAIIETIQSAVEAGGSSVRSYRNALGEAGHYQDQLKVYQRQGQACLRCGHEIQKIKLAQRGTHFCPHCQRLGEEN